MPVPRGFGRTGPLGAGRHPRPNCPELVPGRPRPIVATDPQSGQLVLGICAAIGGSISGNCMDERLRRTPTTASLQRLRLGTRWVLSVDHEDGLRQRPPDRVAGESGVPAPGVARLWVELAMARTSRHYGLPPADALEQAGQQVHPSTVACAAATRLGAPDILDSGHRMGTLAGLVATAGCPGILWRGRVELEALDDRHALSDALIERRRR